MDYLIRACDPVDIVYVYLFYLQIISIWGKRGINKPTLANVEPFQSLNMTISSNLNIKKIHIVRSP